MKKKPFTPTKESAKNLPDGRYRFDRHLYLLVRGNGRFRSWTFVCNVRKKTWNLGLGSVRDVSLVVAKKKAALYFANLLDGRNPREGTLAGALGMGAFVSQAPTLSIPMAVATPEHGKRFRDLIAPAIEQREKIQAWDNPKTRQAWESSLMDYVVPAFGDRPIGVITTDDVYRCLEPIWTTKTELATKLLARIRHVFNYAKMQGLLTGDNPANWKGNLDLRLPPKSMIHTVKHHTAPSVEELARILKGSEADQSTGALCTRFGALTATRVCEFCRARWEEIDLEKAVWTVPVERRKDRKTQKEPFRIPLSRQAMDILKTFTVRSGYVFKGAKRLNSHINLEYPRIFLRRRSEFELTAHGFRSTFDDWGAENGENPVACEKSLMHQVGSKTTQAYKRTDLLEMRREIMQRWADTIFPDGTLKRRRK